MSDARDAGYDDWLEAVEAGEAYFLECPEGHGSLPPRRVCPDCGATDLEETPLAEAGEIATVTVTYVPTPAFADDAPYAVAVADFGPVALTGQVVGIDPDDVETGLTVGLEVATAETTGEPVLAFRPR